MRNHDQPGTEPDVFEETDLLLLETLDHALNRGLVISGEVTLSVANVDLVYLGLNLLLSSTETIEKTLDRTEGAQNA